MPPNLKVLTSLKFEQFARTPACSNSNLAPISKMSNELTTQRTTSLIASFALPASLEICVSRLEEKRGMFYHASDPQILVNVSYDHPLYGKDLRNVPDGLIVEAAVRAILPAFERIWSFVALAREEHAEIRQLHTSAYRRVSRVLIQRIKIFSLSEFSEPCLEKQDDLLDAVTLSFIHMAGVFDVLAIINGLLAGETRYENMGWQKARFRKLLRNKTPESIALMEPTAQGGRFLRAVLDLRNTIHHRMPDPSVMDY